MHAFDLVVDLLTFHENKQDTERWY